MRYLLDSNTCIALMRKHPKAVQRLLAVPPGECAISTITSYELQTGVEKCPQPAKERARLQLLLQTIQQLPFAVGAAQEAAVIRALLESQGQTIGPYDLLLAGQVRSLGLILVSANTREFNRVPGLVVENWQA